MKNIDEILTQELKWKPNLTTKKDFVSDSYREEECFLRMNNFPDEPLWTLFYKGEKRDFDDTPSKWSITYRSEQ